MTSGPSADLLARAQEGDEAAFEAVVEPHRSELLAHAYRMLGSPADAEDALQESLLAAWRGLPSFAGRSSLRTWLFRVATNACLSWRRHARRGCCPRATGRRVRTSMTWRAGPGTGLARAVPW